jgi:hypothetical protein
MVDILTNRFQCSARYMLHKDAKKKRTSFTGHIHTPKASEMMAASATVAMTFSFPLFRYRITLA